MACRKLRIGYDTSSQVGPKNVLLLTTSGVEEDVKPIAKQYGIEVISDPDLSKIIQYVDGFVSEKYSRNGEK